jgi:hypothetical protein
MKNGKFVAIYLLVSLFAYPSLLQAQIEHPQNIYRVTVNSRYVLENGARTSNFFAIGQLFYDSLGRMHTEITYDWETKQPSSHKWHYFEGQTKRKTDFFENNKLIRIEEYNFNNSGLLNQLLVHMVSTTDTSLLVKEVYSYNTANKISKATGYNNRGRKEYVATMKYDIHGNEIQRKVKGKRASPPDSILFLKRTIEYDTLNRMVAKIEIIEKVGQQRNTKSESFKYDSKGNIIEVFIKDNDGNQFKRKEFIYRSNDNRIQQQIVFDSNNNLIDHLAWRYEIYRTSDRRVRTLE